MLTLKQLYILSNSTIKLKAEDYSFLEVTGRLLIENEKLANKYVKNINAGKFELIVEVE